MLLFLLDWFQGHECPCSLRMNRIVCLSARAILWAMLTHFSNRIVLAVAISTLCCGVVSAQKPALAKAENQSLTWVMQDSGTTAGLRGIDSVDGKIAWASGTGGTVLRTIDGGAHWLKCATPGPDGETLDFRGIQAWDATTAIVMASGPGEKSRLYKTADGCKNWTLLFQNPDSPDGFLDSFWIDEHGDGLLLGDPVRGRFAVFWTHDRGLSWQRDSSPDLGEDANELGGFAASNSLILHGLSDNGPALGVPVVFGVGGKGGAFLFSHSISTNCTTMIAHDDPEECKKLQYSAWQQIPVPIAHGSESAGIFAVGLHQNFAHPARMTNEQQKIGFKQVWIAVGGDYSKPHESVGTAAWSDDQGKDWFASKTPPHGYRSSVAWSIDLNAWIAVGTDGSDVSRDDGYTWQPVDDGNWNALSLPFVVGPKGRIARIVIGASK
jgi:photosystem II stability/assembly factor-like uncharacterized protein